CAGCRGRQPRQGPAGVRGEAAAWPPEFTWAAAWRPAPGRSASPPAVQLPIDLASGLVGLLGLALLVLLLAATDRDLDLDLAALEVDRQGQEGHALLPHQPVELGDLL